MKLCGLPILLGLIAASSVRAADQSALLPDIGLRVACPRQPSDANLRTVERKMFDDGFDVLDIVALARERHAYYPFRVKIEALDKAGRNVSLLALDLPGEPGQPKASQFVIHVALYSRPPTHRDTALESAIISWTTEGLGCAAGDIDRNVNGPTALEIYERTVDSVRNLFKEAREMKAGQNALLPR